MDDHAYRVIPRRFLGDKHRGRHPRGGCPRLEDVARVALVRGRETRGHFDNGKVEHFQVTLKVGFTLEGN